MNVPAINPSGNVELTKLATGMVALLTMIVGSVGGSIVTNRIAPPPSAVLEERIATAQRDIHRLEVGLQELERWKDQGGRFTARDHSVYAAEQARELVEVRRELAALTVRVTRLDGNGR
jgi:hypothetical protein